MYYLSNHEYLQRKYSLESNLYEDAFFIFLECCLFSYLLIVKSQ